MKTFNQFFVILTAVLAVTGIAYLTMNSSPQQEAMRNRAVSTVDSGSSIPAETVDANSSGNALSPDAALTTIERLLLNPDNDANRLAIKNAFLSALEAMEESSRVPFCGDVVKLLAASAGGDRVAQEIVEALANHDLKTALEWIDCFEDTELVSAMGTRLGEEVENEGFEVVAEWAKAQADVSVRDRVLGTTLKRWVESDIDAMIAWAVSLEDDIVGKAFPIVGMAMAHSNPERASNWARRSKDHATMELAPPSHGEPSGQSQTGSVPGASNPFNSETVAPFLPPALQQTISVGAKLR